MVRRGGLGLEITGSGSGVLPMGMLCYVPLGGHLCFCAQSVGSAEAVRL